MPPQRPDQGKLLSESELMALDIPEDILDLFDVPEQMMSDFDAWAQDVLSYQF